MRSWIHYFAFTFVLAALGGCQSGGSGGSVTGNELGSSPSNEREAIQYKQAILRCYKSGGSRVVKIEGQLRCF